jgi:hypothetical protein
MSKKLVLAVLMGLLIATVAATNGFGQAPGDDQDNCPGVEGTASGCPDTDGDGIPDTSDRCPHESIADGPDTIGAGCPEPITTVNYRFRLFRRPGVRLTSLKLDVITKGPVTARCAGRACRNSFRRRGRSLVFRLRRVRIRRGTLVKITTRNPSLTSPTECFRLRVRGRNRVTLKARRAITLAVPSVTC